MSEGFVVQEGMIVCEDCKTVNFPMAAVYSGRLELICPNCDVTIYVVYLPEGAYRECQRTTEPEGTSEDASDSPGSTGLDHGVRNVPSGPDGEDSGDSDLALRNVRF